MMKSAATCTNGHFLQKDFNSAFLKMRQYLGYKVTEIAEDARVSRITIQNIESGKPCTLETAIKITTAMGYDSLSDFMTEAASFAEYNKPRLGEVVSILRKKNKILQRELEVALLPDLSDPNGSIIGDFERAGKGLSESRISQIPFILGYKEGYKAWPKMIAEAEKIQQDAAGKPPEAYARGRRAAKPKSTAKGNSGPPYCEFVISGVSANGNGHRRWVDAYLESRSQAAPRQNLPQHRPNLLHTRDNRGRCGFDFGFS